MPGRLPSARLAKEAELSTLLSYSPSKGGQSPNSTYKRQSNNLTLAKNQVTETFCYSPKTLFVLAQGPVTRPPFEAGARQGPREQDA